MRPPSSNQRVRALTASASQITSKEAELNRRLQMPWQYRALYYCDVIGELNYASNFYARMLSKLKLYPGIREDDDSITPITSGEPVSLLNRIQDPGGGRSRMLTMYGQLQFITGECYLFGRNIGLDEPEIWTMVWRDELRFDDIGKVTHMIAPQIPVDQFDIRDDALFEKIPEGEAVAYRLWTPSPRFSGWAHSPMKAVLEEAEELLVLSRSVMATATSRLVRSKLLVLPQEISPTPPDVEGDEDPMQDKFLQDFTQHLERAIADPAAASSLAPYILYVAGEYISMIDTIELHDPATDYLERDLRKECLERILMGLDLPPEVVKGMSDANHWAAWWVSDDMWRSHGAPKAEQLCDDLCEGYLRKALREAEYENWQNVVIGFDASAVVVNPDRSKDADQAWDRGAIGYSAYRVAKNFRESDSQTEEEHLEWLAIKKVLVDAEGNPIPSSGAGAGLPTEEQIATGDEPGTPDGEPGATSENTNLPVAASAATERFLGAAEMALIRCREVAGSRVRTRRTKCPECFIHYEGVDNTLLASAMGQEVLETLGIPGLRELVAGGCDTFRALMLSWGYSVEDAGTIADFLELHAARTLYEVAPRVPPNLALSA